MKLTQIDANFYREKNWVGEEKERGEKGILEKRIEGKKKRKRKKGEGKEVKR